MNVRRRPGWRLVFPFEPGEFDIVTYQIQIRVDAKVKNSLGARETACEDGVGGPVDDLVGGGEDVVCGCEVEERAGIVEYGGAGVRSGVDTRIFDF